MRLATTDDVMEHLPSSSLFPWASLYRICELQQIFLICALWAGIDVGQHFYSRAEMVSLGMHSHWLNGIDYMGASYSKLVRSIHILFQLNGNCCL